MTFSSTVFLFYFFPLTIIAYYIVSWKWKNSVLLVASLLFYSWGEPVNILWMLFLVAVNYAMALLIEKRNKYKQLFVVIGVSSCLSLLVIFKYLVFIIASINKFGGFDFPVPLITMPTGRTRPPCPSAG